MKQQSLVGSRLRLRKSFGRIASVFEPPDLIGLQRQSYEDFLQKDVLPEERKPQGLQSIFQSVFPISDYNEKVRLEFVKYRLFHPKYDVTECRQRGMSYASVLKVTLRLVVFEEGAEKKGGKKSIRDMREQEVYLSDIPLMTDFASFIINGTERVVVSQLHRSPGVFLIMTEAKTPPAANTSTPPALFPIAALGWILNLIKKIWSMLKLTGSANFRPRFFSKP